MKNVLIFSALLASVLAVPGGYYYQQSSSKSSSSSFQNNELQHQTDDESHFSEHGDLEGRVDPKIKTYKQHIEYQNPNSQGHGQTTNFGNQNAFGHLDNTDRYTSERGLGSDGIVRTVSGYAGDRNQYTYSATYGVSGGEEIPLRGGQYDTQSDLLSLTQRLQNDLSRQLNSVTQQRHETHGSNIYVESELRELENQLKTNLTRQLQEKLQSQYGTQANRGSHSYSIKSGRYSANANYNTQELDDLTRQMETNLMQQLRNQYQSTQGSSSTNYYASQASQQGSQGSRAHTTMYRPYREPFPLTPEVRPVVPLTEVVSQVQTHVDRNLNEALLRLEQQYLSQDVTYNNVPNYDIILENLKDEIRRNLTTQLQNSLTQQYGAQEEHHDYYYTSNNVASGLRVANYKSDDLNSLKQQVENNLLNKIRNSIRQQQENYQTMKLSSSRTQSNTYTNNYPSTPDKVYTSYLVFQPNRRPDTGYSQSSTRNTESSYDSHTAQSNTRPAYRPHYVQTPTDSERFVNGNQPYNTNYGSTNYPSSSQNQETQRTDQLEYDYSPTGSDRPTGSGPTHVAQTPYRGTNYPTNTGGYPSNGGSTYPHTSNNNYPSSRGPGSPTYASSSDNYSSSRGLGSSTYASTNNNYPSSRDTGTSNYASTGDSNYQTNYRASQANSESSYQHASGQRQSGIEYTPGVTRPQGEYQAELINIRDQVQDDISRQLNTAIERQRQSGSSYSSSTVASNQILTDLSEELKRNLTQKIEKTLNEHYGRKGVRGGYTFTVNTGGRINPANYNREQLTALTSQLQEDLLRQLREGLAQESYQQGSAHRLNSNYDSGAAQGSHGSNSYRSYSSGYSYSSGSGQGECCMQADDHTTAQNVINQQNVGPTRGDIGSGEITQKTEDMSKDDLTQQKIESTGNVKLDQSVELEAVPPEIVETSTPGLARNKPSTRPATTEKPKQLLSEQETPTSKASKITEDLINAEKYGNNNQQTEDLHIDQHSLGHTRAQDFDQQHTDNFDQQHTDNFDQQHTDNFDQQHTDNFDQQNLDNFDQQTLGQVDQQTSDQQDLWGHFNQDENSQFTISQQTLLNHDQQLVDESAQTDRINSHSSRYNPSSISQSPYVSQQTQDLSRDNDQIIQQTEHLTQQTEDLTQQTEDLTQKTEDLSQQTEDLHRQAVEISRNTQLTQASNAGSYSRRFRYEPSSTTPKPYTSQRFDDNNEDLSQRTDDLTQQTEDLTQQTEDLHPQAGQISRNPQYSSNANVYRNRDYQSHSSNAGSYSRGFRYQPSSTSQKPYTYQKSEDLSQNNEDLAHRTDDLTQQTEDLAQQSEDLTQHTEDLSQHAVDLTQHTQNFDQQFERNARRNFSRQNQHTSQQTEDLAQRVESLHQNGRGSYGSRYSHSSYGSFNSQESRAYSSSASSSERHLHYGTINQHPIETAGDLEQQHVEKQHASVVQDVSHQAKPIVPSTSVTEEPLLEVETTSTTTAAPGFWKKVGGKISNTYHKAKDSISSSFG